MRGVRLTSILSMSLLLLLVSCGKKDDDKVAISLIPAQPIVFDVDRTIPDPHPENDVDEEITISKNWFQFRFTVENKLESPVTIVVVKMTVTGVKDGEVVTGEASIDPGDLVTSGTTVPTVLLEIPAKGTAPMEVPLYLGNLPEVDTLKYTVTAEFKGWVGDADTPTGPLTYEMKFKTADPN